MCVCVCVCVGSPLSCAPDPALLLLHQDQAIQAKKYGRNISKMPVQLFWHSPRGRGMGQRGTVYSVRGRGRGGAGQRGGSVYIAQVGRELRKPTLQPYTPPSSVVSSSSQEGSSVLTAGSIPVVGGGGARARGSVFSRLGGRSQGAGTQAIAMQEEGYYDNEGGEVEYEEGEMNADGDDGGPGSVGGGEKVSEGQGVSVVAVSVGGCVSV